MHLQALRTGQATTVSSLSKGTRDMAAAKAPAPEPRVEAMTATAVMGCRGTRLTQGMVLAASRAQASAVRRGPATMGTTARATQAQAMVLDQGLTASRAAAQAMVLAQGLRASRAAA